MNIGRKPRFGIRALIRHHSKEYNIKRFTFSTDSEGYTQETPTSEVADLYIQTAFEYETVTETGERQHIDLLGYALPSTDIRLDDEVTVADKQFVVTEVTEMPSEHNVQYKMINLVLVQ